MTNRDMSKILENLQNDEKLAHMRRMMTNYKIGYGYINEAEDPMAGGADPAAGGADPMAGGADPAAGGADPMAGGADPMGGGADPMAGGAGPMGGGMPGAPGAPGAGDPNAAGGQQQQDVETNMEPQGDTGSTAAGDTAGMEDSEDEDEEVIDVDELIKAQDKTEEKIDDLNAKFEKMLAAVDNFEKMIDKNNEHIMSLKAEMEKRNPTTQEQTQGRINVSSPYQVSPEDFEPKMDPEMSATPSAQYVITDKDIDDATDWKNIAQTMDRGFSLMDILDM